VFQANGFACIGQGQDKVPLCYVGVGTIEMSCRVFRVQTDGLIEVSDGAVAITCCVACVAAAIVCTGIAGIRLDRLFKLREGEFVLAPYRVDTTPVGSRSGGIGFGGVGQVGNRPLNVVADPVALRAVGIRFGTFRGAYTFTLSDEPGARRDTSLSDTQLAIALIVRRSMAAETCQQNQDKQDANIPMHRFPSIYLRVLS
jgi:hypothetical protein